MISRVTASGSGMCGVLAFVFFFINFAQVTAGVAVFLSSFYKLYVKLCFSLILIRFSCCFPFLLRANVRWLEFP